MDLPIYLDYHATTPVDPRVLEAMLPYFREHFGNAASRTHSFGWRAQEGVENARKEVAALLGCQSKEIVLTSGATESSNLAIFGLVGARSGRPGHIVTTAIEHPAVMDPCRHLERQAGYRVSHVRPDASGVVDPARVREAITDETVLVSVMMANNEIGTLQPIQQLAEICRDKNVPLHTDAAQAVGKIGIDLANLPVDLLSVSGHKFYAPKGVGALFVRKRSPHLRLAARILGGGHEANLRSGTVNVPGVIGLGAAARLAGEEGTGEAQGVGRLRDRLHQGISAGLDGVHLNGHPERRLAGNLNLSFEGVPGEALLMDLKDLAVSSGAACSSSKPEPSPVLRALGRSPELAHASIRFGLGRFTTEEEIDFAVDRVVETVTRLRGMAAALR